MPTALLLVHLLLALLLRLPHFPSVTPASAAGIQRQPPRQAHPALLASRSNPARHPPRFRLPPPVHPARNLAARPQKSAKSHARQTPSPYRGSGSGEREYPHKARPLQPEMLSKPANQPSAPTPPQASPASAVTHPTGQSGLLGRNPVFTHPTHPASHQPVRRSKLAWTAQTSEPV